MTDEADEKKNDDVEFKLKKKEMISFKIVTTTNEKEMMMKRKVSIEDNDSYMFESLDMKNLIERALLKYHIDDTMLFSKLSETSTFDAEIFSK